ncbi:hypothetical protein M5K25_019415 [Dendrobium thyrsiflorum]|uniref:Uncharacterized protein n=1 Tax=Dendrobium thyrsiflorum TaxID=117978 RepID=A0ABD0UF17_DENTH
MKVFAYPKLFRRLGFSIDLHFGGDGEAQIWVLAFAELCFGSSSATMQSLQQRLPETKHGSILHLQSLFLSSRFRHFFVIKALKDEPNGRSSGFTRQSWDPGLENEVPFEHRPQQALVLLRIYNTASLLSSWLFSNYCSPWKSPSQPSSPMWKSICDTALKAKQKFCFRVTAHSPISLRWDPWCSGSSLIDLPHHDSLLNHYSSDARLSVLYNSSG